MFPQCVDMELDAKLVYSGSSGVTKSPQVTIFLGGNRNSTTTQFVRPAYLCSSGTHCSELHPIEGRSPERAAWERRGLTSSLARRLRRRFGPDGLACREKARALTPSASLLSRDCSGVAMLSLSAVRGLRALPALRLRAQGSARSWGSARHPALPLWAAASVSAASPGGWYEALAASAPVGAAEEVLLSAHEATGLPWWSSIILSTIALRGAVTLPLAAYQHYILAKVRGVGPRAACLLILTIKAVSLLR